MLIAARVDSLVVAGIVVPTRSPIFLSIVAIHVIAGLTAVAAGLVAMTSPKGLERHVQAGTLYYRALVAVVGSMTILTAMRWPEDATLLAIGWSAMACAVVGRYAIRFSGLHRYRNHIGGMGTSYVLMLIAFYVDNGHSLPIWKNLPAALYWAIPAGIGGPLIARAMARHARAGKT